MKLIGATMREIGETASELLTTLRELLTTVREIFRYKGLRPDLECSAPRSSTKLREAMEQENS